ncbi:MAG: divalent-cation tolerance protein CutA [Desulfomonilaceae bacterium]
MASYVLCLVTIDDIEKAADIAKALVSEKLAACVNILPGLRSIYSWKGELCDESECLLFIKTSGDGYPALEARVKELHPYEVPEIIAIPIERGLSAYLRWIDDSLRGK